MTIAVSKALEENVRAVICASTGNTAASAATYAARAGLATVILQPAGAVALGKLAQARAVGAQVMEVRGNFDQALAAARELAARGTHALVNSLNPYRLEGQKTAAFEIVEELDALPDVLALPYGGGGNTRAYGIGFGEWGAGMPRILAGEAQDRGGTVASAIRITKPVHREYAEAAISGSEGATITLSDDAILAAWRELAQDEGVFCEPSSAASLAALIQSDTPKGSLAVCVVTGHGLKDPRTVERSTLPPLQVDPDPDAIAEAAIDIRRSVSAMSATLRVRAPASTANLGPGFDCAGVALELWNELEVSDGDGFEVHGEGEAELCRAARGTSGFARSGFLRRTRESASSFATGSRWRAASARARRPLPSVSPRVLSQRAPRSTPAGCWRSGYRWKVTPTISPRLCTAGPASAGVTGQIGRAPFG